MLAERFLTSFGANKGVVGISRAAKAKIVKAPIHFLRMHETSIDRSRLEQSLIYRFGFQEQKICERNR